MANQKEEVWFKFGDRLAIPDGDTGENVDHILSRVTRKRFAYINEITGATLAGTHYFEGPLLISSKEISEYLDKKGLRLV